MMWLIAIVLNTLYVDWMNEWLVDWWKLIWASEVDKVAGINQKKKKQNKWTKLSRATWRSRVYCTLILTWSAFCGIHVKGRVEEVPKMPQKQTRKQT